MSPRSTRRIVCRALLLGLAAGCGGGASTESTVPTTAVLDVSSVSLTAVGQTAQLHAAITDQNGNPIDSPTLTWSSSNGAVATVSQSGLVTATGGGSAVITVSAGSASAQAEVSVAQIATQLQKVSGDGQTAAPGRMVALPLTVQVNDAGGSPIPNVALAFSATAGTLTTTGASTGTDGRASTSYTPLATGTQQVTATVVSTSLTATFTETGVSPFAIELQFLTPVTPSQMQAFTAAQERWENLIVSELSDVAVNAPAGDCGANSPEIQRTVDDVLILVTVQPIDGPGSILGQSAPCVARISNKLPAMGLMQFDSDDLGAIESAGLLPAVITHEMGHVLGYGTIWTRLGLLADAVSSGGTDPHFTGSQARTAFDQVGGADYVASLKVPVENTGGPGTADSHWRETVFGNELMTGILNPGVNPLSRVTVASMADLGYSVNVAAADPYTLMPGLRAFARGPGLELKHDLLRIPVREVNDLGQVLRVVEP